jgi:glutathione S-transferase
MLELYQFEMSHYAEKIRLVLDYKGLAYQKIEVTPGIGQVELFQLSGQRQVPVLRDNGDVIADSTKIAEYLDRVYPDKPVIPADPKLRGQCLILEQWADEVLGIDARKGLISCVSQNQSFRTALLPNSAPDLVRTLVGMVPMDFIGNLGSGIGLGADCVKEALRRDLRSLTAILANQPYLLGDHPSLADFAVAGLSLYIKFPTGTYLTIPEVVKGQGVPGIADALEFEPFFSWRDQLYRDFRQGGASPAATGGGGARPTAISID